MTMIYVIAALGGAVLIASAIAYALYQRNRTLAGDIDRLKSRLEDAVGKANQRAHIIHRMQEIQNETNEKKRDLQSGSDSERFDSSLDILSNNRGGSAD